MTEALVDRIVDVFQGNVPKELIIFLISMLPVLELRGGMIAAKLLGVPLLKAFVICYIGNILPIPFILLFIRKIFQFLKRFSGTRKIVEKLEVRSMRQPDRVIVSCNVRKLPLEGSFCFYVTAFVSTVGFLLTEY